MQLKNILPTLALFGLTLFSISVFGQNSLGAWQASNEAKLGSTSAITKIVMVDKSDALLLKLYYSDGSKALFKPNTKTYSSMQAGLAVYRLAKKFNGTIKILYTPMIPFRMSVQDVLEFAADNPKTPVDEAAMLRRALGPGGRAAPENGILVGSNALWAENIVERGTPFSNTTRAGLLEVASRVGRYTGPYALYNDQVSNLFVMDYLIANNDRGGNFHFNPSTGQVWAIDNDDAFMSAKKKTFVASLISNMRYVDSSFMNDLNNYFASVSDQEIAKDIFREYSNGDALGYARQTRARFLQLKNRYLR